MTTIETSEFRKGAKIIHNGVPYSIIDYQHVKPGKGNQFTRTKIRNLQNGTVLEITYKSGERLEEAEVEEKKMSFLYADNTGYNFMDVKTYDQVSISGEVLGEAKNFLLAEMVCGIVFWNGRAMTAELPQHVVLAITYCEPGVRGDTATNVTKPATLETGAIVNVPIFINAGDKVKVDTSSGEYIERVSIGNG